MKSIILPQALKPGDQVALIAPAFQPSEEQLQQALARLKALDLRVDNRVTLQKNDGYFAGPASEITATLHEAFANPEIKAIFCARGGYGCARLLPLLNWDLIKTNPKILIGFSDITALLIAIHHHTGLITFHGPGGSMAWPQITRRYLQQILFTSNIVRYEYSSEATDDIIGHTEEIKTLRPGIAEGALIGGNLSVLTSMIGTPFLPSNWSNKILFLEDVNEEVYRIDRMLTQLKLANILPQIKGLIFGRFNHCTTRVPYSFNLLQVFQRAVQDLKIPVMTNVLFGHQPEMFTLPIGATVRIDSDTGAIELLTPATC